MTRYRIFGASFGSVVAASLVLLLGAGQISFAIFETTGASGPAYVEGRLIVMLAPGTSSQYLQSVNRLYKGRIIRELPLPNTYLIEVPSSSTKSTSTLGAASGSTMRPLDWYINRYKAYSKVQIAEPDYHRTPQAIPNDPYFDQQWGMTMIGMPEAWDIEKGSSDVIVAVLDTGVSLTHPDLATRLMQGYDVADNDNDPSPPPTGLYQGHGTHVAGIIAAATDNGVGVAGVCWQGVRIMPVKLSTTNTPDDLWTSDIIEGLDYAMNHGADVVNMSFGGPFSSAEQQKIQQLDAAGILLVASAGNEHSSVSYPAAFPECIAVSAVGPDGTVTFYSNYGPEVDIAAPGGGGSSTNGIWSTYWDSSVGNSYAAESGTSMAAPHVAGACALLLSAGIARSDVKESLYAGATPVGSQPNNDYGWGILNVLGAFAGSVKVKQPAASEMLQTSTPTFVIEVKNVDLDSLAVYVDFSDVDDDVKPDPGTDETPVISETNVDDYFDPDTGLITFQWPIGGRDPLGPGKHKIYVQARSGIMAERIVYDAIVFFVQPHMQPAGWRMFAMPVDSTEGLTPSSLLGTTGVQLVRYVTTEYIQTLASPGPDTVWSNYAYYWEDRAPLAPYGQEWLPADYAGFSPPDAVVRPHDTDEPSPPAGVGYWLYLQRQKELLVAGTTDRSHAFDINLANGWNMIGNPFPFKVDWNNAQVTFQGRTLTMADAVSKQWISGTIFRYGANGYIAQTAPAGVLVPWEAFWVRAKGDTLTYGPMVLTIPPIPSEAAILGSISTIASVGAASVAGKVAASGQKGWRVALSATAGNLTDSRSAVGQRPDASDGYGPEDIESPPLSPRCLEMRFAHRDWGANSGYYDEDIRALPPGSSGARAPQAWSFEIVCTEACPKVTISWSGIGSLPSGYSLVLRDETTRMTVTLKERGRYTFTTRGSSRRFTLTLVDRKRTGLNTLQKSLG